MFFLGAKRTLQTSLSVRSYIKYLRYWGQKLSPLRVGLSFKGMGVIPPSFVEYGINVVHTVSYVTTKQGWYSSKVLGYGKLKWKREIQLWRKLGIFFGNPIDRHFLNEIGKIFGNREFGMEGIQNSPAPALIIPTHLSFYA